MNTNIVIVGGTITRDPEIRYTPKGTAIGKLTVAVNRKWKTESGDMKDEATFIDIDAFGKTAENIGQYFKKGSNILVQGRLKQDTWDDKQTGQKRSKLCVALEKFDFVDRKQSGDAPAKAQAPKATTQGAPADDGDQAPF